MTSVVALGEAESYLHEIMIYAVYDNCHSKSISHKSWREEGLVNEKKN